MQGKGLYASISVGVKPEEYDFIEELAAENLVPEYITIDIAHGHSNAVINMIQHIKKHLPESFCYCRKCRNTRSSKGTRKCWCRCNKGWYWTWKGMYN